MDNKTQVFIHILSKFQKYPQQYDLMYTIYSYRKCHIDSIIEEPLSTDITELIPSTRKN